MSYQELQKLAAKFAESLTPAKERTKEFNIQRIKMEYFYNHFNRKLRSILGEMEGDIRVLHERGFDPKMLKIFIKMYRDLLEIIKSVKDKEPYVAAEKFVTFVTSRHNTAILDNLEFLIQHHMKSTKIDTEEGSWLGQAQVNTVRDIKELAFNIKQFMKDNPLLPVPRSDFPPKMEEAIPPTKHSPVGSQELTNAALPEAKKKRQDDEVG